MTRIDAIAAAVSTWSTALDLASAQRSAETARNLVLGPDGPSYRDVNRCVEADVLGGSWDDPSARWAQVTQATQDWTEQNNIFPTLRSHPQRIYGWASLTLGTESLDDAREYAGHAQLHVDVARTAIENCPG